MQQFIFRREAVVLIKASIFVSFALGLFGPLYAIFVERIGGDVLDAGIAFGIFHVLIGVFVLAFGTSAFFARHTRALVVFGYALLTLGQAGYLLVQSPTHLFIVQMVLGIAVGILEPSWDSVFAAGLAEVDASRHWSAWAGVSNIMMGLGAAAGGFIVASYSFTALFGIMLVLNIIGTLIASRVLAPPTTFLSS